MEFTINFMAQYYNMTEKALTIICTWLKRRLYDSFIKSSTILVCHYASY